MSKIGTVWTDNTSFSLEDQVHPKWLLWSISPFSRRSVNKVWSINLVTCPNMGNYFAFFHWIKFIVKVKGNGIGTNVAFDDLLVYNNHCAPVDVKMCDPNALQSPKWGRMPIGYWQCSRGPLIGSKCKLFCRSGFMLPRIYNKKKINSENECSRNGWIEDTGQGSTD